MCVVHYYNTLCIIFCSILHRTVSRKDLGTAASLIRLGANPLIKNARNHTPITQLSIKCFPQMPIPANVEEKGTNIYNRVTLSYLLLLLLPRTTVQP